MSATTNKKTKSSGQAMLQAVQNFAAQYNLGCGALAVLILDDVLSKHDVTKPQWAKTCMVSTVFAGSLLGRLVLGRLCDSNYELASMLCALCAFVGSSLCAGFLVYSSDAYIYFSVFRFVLGIGCGGWFPVSAAGAARERERQMAEDEECTESRESECPAWLSESVVVCPDVECSATIADWETSSSELSSLKSKITDSTQRSDEEEWKKTQKEIAHTVGWAFFWQAPGQMAPYVAGLAIVLGFESTETQFRMLNFAGAIPCFVLWVAAMRELLKAKREIRKTPNESKKEERQSLWTGAQQRTSAMDCEASRVSASVNYGSVIVLQDKTRETATETGKDNDNKTSLRLLGAGLSWLLFDIAFYGVLAFTPDILRQVFPDQSMSSQCLSGIFVNFTAVPAIILAIYYIGWFSTRKCQTHGFIFSGLCCLLFGLCFNGHYLFSYLQNPTARFAMFCAVMFALNTGPNLSVYVYPTIMFDSKVRGLYHGYASSAGVVGGFIGVLMFPLVVPEDSADREWDMQVVMYAMAAVCFVGYWVTKFTLPQ